MVNRYQVRSVVCCISTYQNTECYFSGDREHPFFFFLGYFSFEFSILLSFSLLYLNLVTLLDISAHSLTACCLFILNIIFLQRVIKYNNLLRMCGVLPFSIHAVQNNSLSQKEVGKHCYCRRDYSSEPTFEILTFVLFLDCTGQNTVLCLGMTNCALCGHDKLCSV